MKIPAEILSAMPDTVYGLAATTGYSITTIRKTVNRFREQSSTHIGGWRFNEAKRLPVYHAGPGDDVPLLPESTSSDYSRIRRARLAEMQVVRGIVPGALYMQSKGFALAGVWV